MKKVIKEWEVNQMKGRPATKIEVEAMQAICNLQDKVRALKKELRALRELREVCGMYCEQLPLEVREALHAVPEIKKAHRCSL